MSDHGDDLQIDFKQLYHRLDEVEKGLAEEGSVSPEVRREILAARAKGLAGTRGEQRDEDVLEVVAFRIGGERYGVQIQEADQVLDIRTLSPLPGAPRHVLGAIVARSRVVPVLDLRQLLGLDGGGVSDLTKVIVVSPADDAFGLAVEAVDGRTTLPRHLLSAPAAGPFILVSSDRLAVLDLAKLGAGREAKEG